MGRYRTVALTNDQYHDIIDCIRDGYLDHRPNPQIATILVLEANLGCRIGDILSLKTDSFVKDGDIWRLDIVEQKTGKERYFMIPKAVKDFIDKWIEVQCITTGKLFTVTGQAVWKALRQVCDYLEIEKISTHSFRKKIASDMFNKTHDIEVVREFLQHSSVTITQKYIQRSSKQVEDAIMGSIDLV